MIVFSECAIKVNHMQPTRPFAQPAARRLCRIIVVGCHARGVALLQAHHAPCTQIDRRKDRKTHVASRKFFRILKPTAWLFSGWNCTPKRFPRCTAQAYVRPYSVVARISDDSRGWQ